MGNENIEKTDKRILFAGLAIMMFIFTSFVVIPKVISNITRDCYINESLYHLTTRISLICIIPFAIGVSLLVSKYNRLIATNQLTAQRLSNFVRISFMLFGGLIGGGVTGWLISSLLELSILSTSNPQIQFTTKVINIERDTTSRYRVCPNAQYSFSNTPIKRATLICDKDTSNNLPENTKAGDFILVKEYFSPVGIRYISVSPVS